MEEDKLRVKRIVANVAPKDVADQDVLSRCAGSGYVNGSWLDCHLRLAGEDEHTDQLCFRGRRRHAVPDLSIEVDEIEAVLEEMRRAGFSIEYGPVDEPWGVRRFCPRSVREAGQHLDASVT